MFGEKDGEDLRTELGITEKRADELVGIVQDMMDREAPADEYGRTSHILLEIVGRKDLNDVEKAACIFLFCCKTLNKGITPGIGKEQRECRLPEIDVSDIHMHGMGKLKKKEFIDLEGGASGMMIAPEGVGPEEALGPLMAIIMSMLRQMPKSDAQEFCRYASLTFAKIAMKGEIKL